MFLTENFKLFFNWIKWKFGCLTFCGVFKNLYYLPWISERDLTMINQLQGWIQDFSMEKAEFYSCDILEPPPSLCPLWENAMGPGPDLKQYQLLRWFTSICISTVFSGYFGYYMAKKCPLAPPSELQGGGAPWRPPPLIRSWSIMLQAELTNLKFKIKLQ